MALIEPIEVRLRNGLQARIRNAVEDDGAELLRCAKTYIAEGDGQVLEADEFKFTEQQEREWIREMRDEKKTLLLVAEVNGKIVGNLDLRPGPRKRLAHAATLGMGMLADCRSQGLGAAMLGHAIEWARTTPGLERIHLHVLGTNRRAIALYLKSGFVFEGRRERAIKFGPGHYADDIQMSLDLSAT